MQDIKDVTSTTFGLIIAYLLPGIAGLYAMSFWSVRIETWFGRVLDGDASFGLILFMILGATVVGLQLSVVRSLVFECVLCRDCHFDSAALTGISDAGKFAAYRMLIDEQLRYHQFWGAMSVAQPVLFYGWIAKQQVHRIPIWVSVLLTILCEAATIYAAIESLRRYAAARRTILTATTHA